VHLPSGKIESYGTLYDMDCEICLYMSSARLQPIVFQTPPPILPKTVVSMVEELWQNSMNSNLLTAFGILNIMNCNIHSRGDTLMLPDCAPSGKSESYGTLNGKDCGVCL
jgi:hypothetical protein